MHSRINRCNPAHDAPVFQGTAMEISWTQLLQQQTAQEHFGCCSLS